MKNTILIAGIHGVGKTYYCSLMKNEHFEHYTASSLIKKASNLKIDDNKKVENVNSNQQILIEAFKELRNQKDTIFLFDGHFVLLDKNMNFQKISLDVFKEFNLSEIIILIDNVSTIARRLKDRDNKDYMTTKLLSEMQNLEIEHGKFIAEKLNIPLHIINLEDNHTDKEFITKLSAYI
ncbi:ATP-binding protein [Aliarcobacter butzleri]|uniref:ATP-binding protein n=1 Tax=Aliarcobacter butzleri TaxID=28197 RepID=UPI002B24BDF3|nr:ATP-binding protein [Aliarcobacter butzleri]